MRLLGPNCVGFMNYGLGVIGTFGTASYKGAPRPGAIGLVSQSGAVGAALAQAQEHGTALSHLLTCGNASDIDVADQVAYLAADPACKAIACLFEGMADPSRFLAAAALCNEAGKPLVVHKLGTSERGAQAAVSHTGSVAGSQAAYRAAFQQAGVILVDEVEALLDTCSFFAKAPPPKARGVAVAAVSGGACIMLADKAEQHGVELPHPVAATMEVLERLIPEYGAPGNPCDMTAQVLSTPQQLHDCFEALMADPQYGALVVPHTYAYAPATERIGILGKAAAQHGKIACNVWLTQHLEGPGAIESEQHPHVATFRSMNHCMAALAAWHGRADWLARRTQRDGRLSPPEARDAAARLIDACPHPTLTEREGKEVLAAYGVPVVRELLTHSADEAARAAATGRPAGGAEGRIARHPPQDRGRRVAARPEVGGRGAHGVRRSDAQRAGAFRPRRASPACWSSPWCRRAPRSWSARASTRSSDPWSSSGLGGDLRRTAQGHGRATRSGRRGRGPQDAGRAQGPARAAGIPRRRAGGPASGWRKSSRASPSSRTTSAAASRSSTSTH